MHIITLHPHMIEWLTYQSAEAEPHGSKIVQGANELALLTRRVLAVTASIRRPKPHWIARWINRMSLKGLSEQRVIRSSCNSPMHHLQVHISLIDVDCVFRFVVKVFSPERSKAIVATL